MGMIEFYVSGYAKPGEKGIMKCAFDGKVVDVLDSNDELHNPSWVLHHPDKPLLYAVEELTPEGSLAVLSEEDGHLKMIARVSTGGADPCHISITPDNRYLMVSNYTSGSLAVYELDQNGIPKLMTDYIQHRMDGRQKGNPVRQEAPHIHFSLCDRNNVYVNDLGMNKVFIYDWDSERGRLIDRRKFLDFPDGSGPRHLVFSKDGHYLYVLCELNATIHVFQKLGNAGWRRRHVVSTVPEDFEDFQKYDWSIAAAIHFVDSRTLCASNRGHNSLAVFSVDGSGQLSNRQIIPSGGETPRDFMITDGFLLIANQGRGAVSIYNKTLDCYCATGIILKANYPTCICKTVQRPCSIDLSRPSR